jgi:hypothetical protein
MNKVVARTVFVGVGIGHISLQFARAEQLTGETLPLLVPACFNHYWRPQEKHFTKVLPNEAIVLSLKVRELSSLCFGRGSLRSRRDQTLGVGH